MIYVTQLLSLLLVVLLFLLSLELLFSLKYISEGSASDSDADNDGHDPAEEDTDDDDNEFFDTQDFLSSSRGSDLQGSFDSDDQEPLNSMDDIDSSTRSNGTNYPHVKRRNKLPDAVEKEKGVSLWSIIKENIGKDLTKVCLPVYFNEPISSLQKCFEDLEYSYLLDQAYECGKTVIFTMYLRIHLHFSLQLGLLSTRAFIKILVLIKFKHSDEIYFLLGSVMS